MSLRRRVFTFLNRLRLALRKATGSTGAGVHAVPLTAEGRVVLVRLTYAPGWRVPGGGHKKGEAPEAAMLRELREEIGLVSHGRVERLEDVRPAGPSAYFLVRDVDYRPRRTFEVEAVEAFDPGDLPDDVTDWSARLIGRCVEPESSPASAGEGDQAKPGGGALPE